VWCGERSGTLRGVAGFEGSRSSLRFVIGEDAIDGLLRYPERMPIASPLPKEPRPRIVLPAIYALFGVFGMAAAWVILALMFDRHCAWMAALAAADIALLLRLGRAAGGGSRAMTALLATVATIIIANWGIASSQIGLSMGFGVVDSLYRLGAHFAWTLVGLANHGAELGWYGLALLIAYWLGK
jgi:hypothetical protein